MGLRFKGNEIACRCMIVFCLPYILVRVLIRKSTSKLGNLKEFICHHVQKWTEYKKFQGCYSIQGLVRTLLPQARRIRRGGNCQTWSQDSCVEWAPLEKRGLAIERHGPWHLHSGGGNRGHRHNGHSFSELPCCFPSAKPRWKPEDKGACRSGPDSLGQSRGQQGGGWIWRGRGKMSSMHQSHWRGGKIISSTLSSPGQEIAN